MQTTGTKRGQVSSKFTTNKTKIWTFFILVVNIFCKGYLGEQNLLVNNLKTPQFWFNSVPIWMHFDSDLVTGLLVLSEQYSELLTALVCRMTYQIAGDGASLYRDRFQTFGVEKHQRMSITHNHQSRETYTQCGRSFVS